MISIVVWIMVRGVRTSDAQLNLSPLIPSTEGSFEVHPQNATTLSQLNINVPLSDDNHPPQHVDLEWKDTCIGFPMFIEHYKSFYTRLP